MPPLIPTLLHDKSVLPCVKSSHTVEFGVYFIAFSDKSMIEICKNEDVANVPTEMTAPGLRHIALNVDDFEATVASIRATGVEILTEPVTLPNGVSTMFFRDIEGNIRHLISRKTPLV